MKHLVLRTTGLIDLVERLTLEKEGEGDAKYSVVAGKTKVFSIPSWKYNFDQESTNLGEFQYTLGQKV